MKNPKPKDLFQEQLKDFTALLNGSKMAVVSAILLALFSLFAAYICSDKLGQAIPLVIGAVIQIVYTYKYLQLSGIKQKAYTQMSLQSSISKFKVYVSKRKRYEKLIKKRTHLNPRPRQTLRAPPLFRTIPLQHCEETKTEG